MALACPNCCVCPVPEVAFVSRAASKSKGGAGCAFVNPVDKKVYLIQTTQQSWSASVTALTDAECASGSENKNWSCQIVCDPKTGTSAQTCEGSWTSDYGAGDNSCSSDCTMTNDGSWVGTITFTTDGDGGGTFPFETTFPEAGCYERNPVPWCALEPPLSPQTVSYSSEYTTADLIALTIAALPAWGALSAFGGGYPSELASTEMSSDGSSYSVMDSKYQLAHPVPPTGTYKLTWIERFTPDGGGSPTDTPKTYAWDGTTPSGYKPSDSTTWPKTEVFEVDHPPTNGAITLHNLSVDCGIGPVKLFS